MAEKTESIVVKLHKELAIVTAYFIQNDLTVGSYGSMQTFNLSSKRPYVILSIGGLTLELDPREALELSAALHEMGVKFDGLGKSDPVADWDFNAQK